jgi:hypothetical protein
VGLELGPLSLVSTTEKLLGIKIVALVYRTKVGTNFADKRQSRSVCIVHSRTKATEVVLFVCLQLGGGGGGQSQWSVSHYVKVSSPFSRSE